MPAHLAQKEHAFHNGFMAKRKPRRKGRKFKTEDLLADFRRVPQQERVLALKRLELRLRRAGLLALIVFSLLVQSC